MADYEVIWKLNGERLPVINQQLANYLMASGQYDEFSCPNSFFSRKGTEPARAVVVLDYARANTLLNGVGVPLVTLGIEYNALNANLEIPSQNFEITLVAYKISEVLGNRKWITDDSLCVLELRDQRLFHKVGREHADVSSSNLSGILDRSSSNLIDTLWDSGGDNGYIKPLNTNNQFIPEQGAKQRIWQVAGLWSKFFHEAVQRTENIFFQDKDGTPVVQRLSHSDAGVASFLSEKIDECSASESLYENDRRDKVVFPQNITCWFWKDSNKTELVDDDQNPFQNYFRPIQFQKDWGYSWADRQAIYPITDPENENIRSVRSQVASNYASEISNQTAIDPQYYILNGNIDFEWKSQITSIAYTNNPFGVKTYVSIEPRHGQPFWEMPDGRNTKLSSPQFAEIAFEKLNNNGVESDIGNLTANTEYDYNLVINRLTNVQGYKDPSSRLYPYSEVFEMQFLYGKFRIILKKPGTYIYRFPIQLQWANPASSGATVSLTGATDTVTVTPYTYEQVDLYTKLVSPPGSSTFIPQGSFYGRQIEHFKEVKQEFMGITADAVNGAGNWVISNPQQNEKILKGHFSLSGSYLPVELQIWGKFSNVSLDVIGPDIYETFGGTSLGIGDTDRRGGILYIPNEMDTAELLGLDIVTPI